MKILYKHIDKKNIADLPVYRYEGSIHVIDEIPQAETAIKTIFQNSIIGIDTETKPAFKKGISHKVALLQIATIHDCYLFRLNKIGLPLSIIELFEKKEITKVGLSLKDDLRRLQQRKQFQANNFIDIQNEITNLGIEDKSLQKIFANLFGCKICKSSRLTNWENEYLTEAQKHYAALDAYSCLLIYDKYKELRDTNSYTLINDNKNNV